MQISVNGEQRRIVASARTHLADVLREECGLTGTHIGCEQGVCGACTVIVNGAPTRSCLLYAHEAAGMEVITIEGLDEDPVAEALRAAFSKHHALQCGYCTPGMMVTARDIVTRLGAVDEARIRDELAGNLCRCTGYRGIVRAIAEVAASRPVLTRAAVTAAPILPAPAPAPVAGSAAMAAPEFANQLTHRVELAIPLETAWAILSNPARVAACLPGARLLHQQGEAVDGEVSLALGPFTARFAGSGTLTFDHAHHRGLLRGKGRDGGNGAEGQVGWLLTPTPSGCVLELELGWRLTGPLAQFSRPGLVRGLVAGMAGEFARNLESAARGEAPAPTPSLWSLLLRMLRGWFRG
ncbi:2Fe-2S iron-sulfur cluster-binding protein [Roseococcus sp. YIM B11640]|uniref:2Fe-2S iron-sulfur cluster-binding protein n=1 Tax=Roseococcus sp. YIM B11640 TaxID=3133973 RepID=UPI003C7CB36D